MFIELLINAFLFSLALGGTVCPPRSDMHPCVCTNVIVSQRKLHTTVNCHHLPNSNAFNVILPSLRKMEIDKFILYDSFWEAHRLGDSDNKTALPPDWLRLLKIKEFEIYDTALTSNFACHPKMVCKNTFTHRFIAVNSSTSDTFVSMCTRKENDGKVIHTPWIACMNNLKYFQYSHGRLTNLSKEWFPIKMKELLVVNLTQNYIKIINPGDFNNLIKLTALDLSHNLIEYLDFFSITTTLEILDLRWNRIKEIDEKQFVRLARLKSLMLENNDIVYLKEISWKKVPKSLKYIGLTGNPIICDCNIRWINTTILANVTIRGTCSSRSHKEITIRSAVSHWLKKCDKDGNIVTRTKSSYTSPINLHLSEE